MQQRPLSLTIIGWLVVVGSIFILLTGGSPTRNSPTIDAMIASGGLPIWTHAAVGGVGGLLGLACGCGILKGWKWARYTYVGMLIAGVAFRVATGAGYAMLLIGIVYLIVIAMFLFRNAADNWFASGAMRGERAEA